MFTYRVEVYTDSLLISGSYDVMPYSRLSDALNNSPSRYFVLRDAIISPLNRPHQVQPVSFMFVDRHNVPVVTTLREPAPPSDYRRPALAGRFETHQMMFFTPVFALRATYHKRPGLGLQQALEQTTDPFIPITTVHIFQITGRAPTVREFACLGRNYIQALYSIEASDDPRPNQEELAPW